MSAHNSHMTTTQIHPLETVASDVLDTDRIHIGGAWRTIVATETFFATREIIIRTADGGEYAVNLDAPVSVLDLR